MWVWSGLYPGDGDNNHLGRKGKDRIDTMCVINIIVQCILRLMRPHLMEIPDEYDYCHFPRRGPFLSRFTILQTRVGGGGGGEDVGSPNGLAVVKHTVSRVIVKRNGFFYAHVNAYSINTYRGRV